MKARIQTTSGIDPGNKGAKGRPDLFYSGKTAVVSHKHMIPERMDFDLHNGEETRPKDACPVKECSAGGFCRYFPLLRHMITEHPDTDHPPLKITDTGEFAIEGSPKPHSNSTRQKQYECPVLECPRYHNRYEDLRQHIHIEHDETNHSRVLKAVFSNQSLQLDFPPSRTEYLSDIARAKTTSAKPESFLHRPDEKWKSLSLSTRTRIAHGCLIQDRYGVLAPVPCDSCWRRGTTCMVYHPYTNGESGKPPHRWCSTCLDRGVPCGLDQFPFKRYLSRASDEAATREADDANANMDLYGDPDDFPEHDGAHQLTQPRHGRNKQTIPDSDDMDLDERVDATDTTRYVDLGSSPESSRHSRASKMSTRSYGYASWNSVNK